MRLMALYLFVAALCAATAAAADVAPPLKLSAADMDRMAAAASAATVPLGQDGPTILVLRRTKSGQPEVHDGLNDFFVVRSGQATVHVGGKVTGNREVSPGEWRGGVLTGATAFDIGPGDTLWIPAGMAHQIVIPEGGALSYLAFKSGRTLPRSE